MGPFFSVVIARVAIGSPKKERNAHLNGNIAMVHQHVVPPEHVSTGHDALSLKTRPLADGLSLKMRPELGSMSHTSQRIRVSSGVAQRTDGAARAYESRE